MLSWFSAAFLDRVLAPPWSGLAPEKGSAEWSWPPRTHAQLVKLSPPVVQPSDVENVNLIIETILILLIYTTHCTQLIIKRNFNK